MVDIEEELLKILRMCGDAQTLFITDREGVPIITVGEEYRARQVTISSYMASFDQLNKLDMGQHKISVLSYEANVVVVISFPRVTAFFVGKPDANLGMMMKLRHEIEKIIPVIEANVPMLLPENAPQ